MNQETINKFTEYLANCGYSRPTVKLYTRVISQIPEAWNEMNISMLYKHINLALQGKASRFAERDYKNVSPALSQYFQMISDRWYLRLICYNCHLFCFCN